MVASRISLDEVRIRKTTRSWRRTVKGIKPIVTNEIVILEDHCILDHHILILV
jgi:hypothetical protein